MKIGDYTISVGASESQSIRSDCSPLALLFKSINTPANCTIKVSEDGIIYYPIVDPETGVAKSFLLLATGCLIPIDVTLSGTLQYIKIVMPAPVTSAVSFAVYGVKI